MLRQQVCEIQERKSSCIGIEYFSVEHSDEFSKRPGPRDIALGRVSVQLTRDIGLELELEFRDGIMSGFGEADNILVVSE